MTITDHRFWAIVTGLWTVLVVVGFLAYVASHGTPAGLAKGLVGLVILLVAMLVARQWLPWRQAGSPET
jgi:ABC-type transport system involved in cytochrome bd biosynthesis fused ATPase/permease subunit